VIPAFLFFAVLGSGLTVWALWDRIAHFTDDGVRVGQDRYVRPFDIAVVCGGKPGECAAVEAARKARDAGGGGS
jgi:hypothetical protein